MRTLKVNEVVNIPENVTISIKTRTVTVKGPRGVLSKSFRHSRVEMNIVKKGRQVSIDMWFGNRKERARTRTIASHIVNMIKGVTKGYEYKMRMAYAHFPIGVTLEDGERTVAIRNYIGEKKVMKVPLLPGVVAERSNDVKDQIVLRGNDINLVSQNCAQIQQKCRVTDKDIRKFLDGIYVAEKGHIVKDD
eukprot:GILI01008673.1.p1 GENE.GILI01008673.1~~GILI01008673.1.p1  ORF type:complete len:191 (-),score=46.42 GILI01008673.1:97-669(-)